MEWHCVVILRNAHCFIRGERSFTMWKMARANKWFIHDCGNQALIVVFNDSFEYLWTSLIFLFSFLCIFFFILLHFFPACRPFSSFFPRRNFSVSAAARLIWVMCVTHQCAECTAMSQVCHLNCNNSQII